MNGKDFLKKAFEFNKTNFETAYNALVAMQDQAEDAANKALEDNKLMPEGGRKFVKQVMSAFKQNRDTLKRSLDKGSEQMEKYLNAA